MARTTKSLISMKAIWQLAWNYKSIILMHPPDSREKFRASPPGKVDGVGSSNITKISGV
jgi:hypothetical protein